jgi:preprotein translocase subunit YajC
MGYLITIVVLGLLGFFFVVRPQRRRTQAHEAMQDALELGDEIITAGGIHGHVRELADDHLRVEIAPGTLVTLDRRAVAAVARELDDEPAEAPEQPAATGTSAEPR